MLDVHRLIRPALMVGGMILLGSAPVSAEGVYRWVTKDGTVAFTDEAKRIPEGYRQEATKLSLRSLEGYARFTPTDARAQGRYAAELDEQLVHLRALNAEPVEEPSAPGLAGEAASHPVDVFDLRSEQRRAGRRLVGRDAFGRPVYRRTSREQVVDEPVPAIRFPVDPDDAAPVIVERRRVLDGDTGATRHVTVVEQGGRVVGVIKPRVHAGPLYRGYEEDLEP